ncbi:MAG: Na+:solute symporter [Candidatus Omnitrophica bacterium]|nr:Na+:solute symporter [Candidatus Omnitrophota bacterium]
MHVIDWTILASYLLLSLGVSFLLRKRASLSPQHYFLSGRSLPWWILGTSMAATTFAADTPLAVTGLTLTHGVSGNWLWWSAMFAGVTSAVLFAPLWRRAKLLTDIELIELRYSGKEASILRGFLALYHGLLLNCMTMGWVLLAMGKILKVLLGWEPLFSMSLSLSFVILYTLLSGLWGVVMTDLFQFAMAMIGSYFLAWASVQSVGGLGGLLEKLKLNFGPQGAEAMLSPFPTANALGPSLPWAAFFTYVLIMWWNKLEIEGGGYLSQRMLAAKSEKDAYRGTLWFVFANYVLRTWPWILTALVAAVTFPGLEDPEMAYPKMMTEVLPAGMLGLLVTAMVAAFMSTIDTHLNWGTSYLIHDVYARFLRPRESPTHYVLAAKVTELILGVTALLLALQMESIAGVWQFLFAMTAGLGTVRVLRWIWWRVNAYTEMGTMASSFVIAIVLETQTKLAFDTRFLITCSLSLLIALIITFLTPPTSLQRQKEFFEKVKPPALFWGKVAEGKSVAFQELFQGIGSWCVVTTSFLLCLLGPGYLLLGRPLLGFWMSIAGIILFGLFLKIWQKGMDGKRLHLIN